MIEETAAIPQAEIDHEVGATRQQIGPSVAILAEQGSRSEFCKTNPIFSSEFNADCGRGSRVDRPEWRRTGGLIIGWTSRERPPLSLIALDRERSGAELQPPRLIGEVIILHNLRAISAEFCRTNPISEFCKTNPIPITRTQLPAASRQGEREPSSGSLRETGSFYLVKASHR
jgi:hypothetical protein